METASMSEGLLINERYRLIRKLGAGGMGEVWETRLENSPDERYAIKFLYEHDRQSEQFERFTREAKILDRLNHPNITTVIDYLVEHKPPYIVLEYLEGEPLSERLARVKAESQSGLEMNEVIAIVSQVRNALEKTHQEGVIHRDLKPENIYLCHQGNAYPPLVKVLDFGVSKMNGEQQITQHQQGFLGTPQYMSPEQALGHTDIDSRADQFSLGIIIYEMLSGELPFKGEQIIQIATQIVHGDPAYIRELVPQLPEQAAQALHRSLCKSPDDRYPSCEAFIDEFVYGAQQEIEDDEWANDAPTEVGIRHSIIHGASPIHHEHKAQQFASIDEARDTHRSLPVLSPKDAESQQDQEERLEGPATVQMAYNPALFEHSDHQQNPYVTAEGQQEASIPQRLLRPPTIKLQPPTSASQHPASTSQYIENQFPNASSLTQNFEDHTLATRSDPTLFPQVSHLEQGGRSKQVKSKKNNVLGFVLIVILAVLGAIFSLAGGQPTLKERAESLNQSPILKGALIMPQHKSDLIGITLVQGFDRKKRRLLKKTRTLPQAQTQLKIGQANLIIQINQANPAAKELISKATVHWFGPQEQHRIQALTPLPKPLQRYGYWQTKLKFNPMMIGRWVALISSEEKVLAEFPFEVKK